MLERLNDRGALVPQKPSISNFSTTKWAFSLKNVWGSTYLFPMVTYPSYAPTFSNEKRVGTNNQIRGRCRADRGLVRVTDNKTCSKNYPGGRKGKGEENRDGGFPFYSICQPFSIQLSQSALMNDAAVATVREKEDRLGRVTRTFRVRVLLRPKSLVLVQHTLLNILQETKKTEVLKRR